MLLAESVTAPRPVALHLLTFGWTSVDTSVKNRRHTQQIKCKIHLRSDHSEFDTRGMNESSLNVTTEPNSDELDSWSRKFSLYEPVLQWHRSNQKNVCHIRFSSGKNNRFDISSHGQKKSTSGDRFCFPLIAFYSQQFIIWSLKVTWSLCDWWMTIKSRRKTFSQPSFQSSPSKK